MVSRQNEMQAFVFPQKGKMDVMTILKCNIALTDTSGKETWLLLCLSPIH